MDDQPPAATPRTDLPKPDLMVRALSAIAMGLGAIVSLAIGGLLYDAFWMAASLAVLAEWQAMIGARRDTPLIVAGGIAIAASYILSQVFAVEAALAGLAAGVVVAGLLLKGRRPLWLAAGLGYAGLLSIAMTAINQEPLLGVLAVVWMFAVVWTTDTAAYFTGRRLGGPKLWPAISPKKTWSGLIGGVIAGTLAGTLVILFGYGDVERPLNLNIVALVSGLAALASQGGDLAESAMKRHFDVKDSGRIIPGHGGLMDRLDGFWVVAMLLLLTVLFIRFQAAAA